MVAKLGSRTQPPFPIMKTSRFVAVTLLFIFSLGICRANLGETEAQCVARYGDESDVQTNLGYRQVGDKAASFTRTTPNGALAIRVIFLNGASCHETISNADSSRGLSEDQMKAILDAQRAGLEWRKRNTVYRTNGSGETAGREDWQRSDGATATFWVSRKAGSEGQSGEMELSTKQYASAQHFYDQENGAN